MTDWNRFFTGEQLRNAIAAQGELPTATGATFSFLIYDATASQIEWLDIGSVTATVTASATDTGGIQARAQCVWDVSLAGDNVPVQGRNVSSVTKLAAGKWRVNFATGAGTATVYGWQISGPQATGAANSFFYGRMGSGSQLATGMDFVSIVANANAFADPVGFLSAVFWW